MEYYVFDIIFFVIAIFGMAIAIEFEEKFKAWIYTVLGFSVTIFIYIVMKYLFFPLLLSLV